MTSPIEINTWRTTVAQRFTPIAHSEPKLTKLDHITKANYHRRKAGVNTDQDLLELLNNALGSMSPALKSKWGNYIADLTCDIEGDLHYASPDICQSCNGTGRAGIETCVKCSDCNGTGSDVADASVNFGVRSFRGGM